jgi:phage I-like protein
MAVNGLNRLFPTRSGRNTARTKKLHSGVLQELCIGNVNAVEKTTAPALGIAVALVNRKPDGTIDVAGWYLIAPYGEHPHGDSGFIQVIDEEAVEAMVNALKPGEELLSDFEHDSHNPDKPTRASGWTHALRKGTGGLEAKTRWSGSGKTALQNEDYRYVSPVWLARDCEIIDAKKIRPRRLNDSGLTNTPNLKNMPAISNRQLIAAIQSHAGDNEESADQRDAGPSKQQKETMKKLNAELGLSPDASEESAIEAITKLKNSAKAGQDALTPLQAEHDKLKNSHQELLEAQVESDLDTAGVEGEERATFKTQLLANRSGALPLLAALSKAKGNATASALTNRAGAKTPPAKKGVGGDDLSRQQQMENVIANAKGATFEERFENAKRSNPDLFKAEEPAE